MSGHSQPLGKPVPPSFPAGSDKLENCEHKAEGGPYLYYRSVGWEKAGCLLDPSGDLSLGLAAHPGPGREVG